MDLFTFSIQKNNHAVPMSLIFEIIKATSVVPSSNYPEFAGFINHRNMIYPVVLLPGSSQDISLIVLMKVKGEVIGVGLENMGQIAHSKDIQRINTFGGKSSQVAVVGQNLYCIIDPEVDLPPYTRNFENDVAKLKTPNS